MTLNISGIPAGWLVPGSYVKVDNSKANQGLIPWYQKILVMGQMITEGGNAGTATAGELILVTSGEEAELLFGPGSMLARMCMRAKNANPYMEMWAMPLADAVGGVPATATLNVTGTATESGLIQLMLAGEKVQVGVTSGDTASVVIDSIVAAINARLDLPIAATDADPNITLAAKNDGAHGNDYDVRWNYYQGEKLPAGITLSLTTAFSAGTPGAGDPLIADAIAVLGDQRFDYIIYPYNSTSLMDLLETELADRYGPMEQIAGIGFTAYKGTQSSCVSMGSAAARNSPHMTCEGYDDAPTPTEEWAAAYGAIAAFYLNQAPARPLKTLELPGILPPKEGSLSRWDPTEQNLLLQNGISTWEVNPSGNVAIQRAVTMYLKNESGVPDPSYRNLNTMAQTMYVRYQLDARIKSKYPRYSLADNDYEVQPGQHIIRPMDIHNEIVALFSLLQDQGVVEGLDTFKQELIVERDSVDPDRVNALMPANYVNQFYMFAGVIQFRL